MSAPDLINEALSHARDGLAVFAAEPYRKTPMPGVSWPEVSTTSTRHISAHWPRGANIGVDCGKSGIVVIDLDRHDPEADGVAAFTALCEEHEADRDWPDTYTVVTPTDGYHLYFENPGGLGNGEGALPAGINVRGTGGYVLGAGSVVDRRAYEGKPELQALVGDGRAYQVYNDAPIIRRRPWLLEVLHKSKRRRPSGEACHALAREWPSVTLARLNGELRKVERTLPGASRGQQADGSEKKPGRNSQLYESACRFGEVVAIGRIDADRAVEELKAAAEACGLTADDGEAAVEATIDSGLRKGAADLAGGDNARR